MSTWQFAFGSMAVVAGVAALYGLHRLALWLEERGHLYYIHKSPRGSAAGCFVALQKAVEPQAQHVLLVGEEVLEEGEATGPDHPLATGRIVPDSPNGRRPAFPGSPEVKPQS